jgi:hypothetical protein
MQSCQTLKRHASAAFFEAPSPAFRTPPRPYRELLGPELPGEALGRLAPGLDLGQTGQAFFLIAPG